MEGNLDINRAFKNRDKKALPPLIRIQKQIAAGHVDASSVLPGGIVHAPLPLDVHFFGLGPIIEMMRALRKSTISASCNNNSGSHGMFLSWGSGVTKRISGQKTLLRRGFPINECKRGNGKYRYLVVNTHFLNAPVQTASIANTTTSKGYCTCPMH
jgi:hypothetical protein